MESALYGIYALVVFVSEHSCVNTVRAHFPWSNLYIFIIVERKSSLDGTYDEIPVAAFDIYIEEPH